MSTVAKLHKVKVTYHSVEQSFDEDGWTSRRVQRNSDCFRVSANVFPCFSHKSGFLTVIEDIHRETNYV